MRQSRAFGVELRKRLDTAIRQDVLPPLGLELGRWAGAQGWDGLLRPFAPSPLTSRFRLVPGRSGVYW